MKLLQDYVWRGKVNCLQLGQRRAVVIFALKNGAAFRFDRRIETQDSPW